MKKFKNSLFIFRRDLRLNDNTGLINALESSDCVFPIFILDKRLLKSSQIYSSFRLPTSLEWLYKRPQKRYHLLQFLRESLLELQKQFDLLDKSQLLSEDDDFRTKKSSINHSKSKLVFLYNDPSLLIKKILKTHNKIEAIFVNRDYTPYSMRRDSKISSICKSSGVEFIQCADSLLNEPEEIQNSESKPFKVFYQYYNKSKERQIRKVNNYKINKYKDVLFSLNSEEILTDANTDVNTTDDDELVVGNVEGFFDPIINNQLTSGSIEFIGGRKGFENVIANFKNRLKNYKDEKDIIVKGTTSNFSTYLKFGICSIREAYFIIHNELGDDHPLLRQLYWRDFFTYIGFHFPYVFTEPFQEKYRKTDNRIQWRNNPKQFDLWCSGKTGFPIVDAGMRKLNTTGYMHNRLRLTTASFLIKDLHIDWRYGERYFALKLIDYDPSVNNGNWQWVASTGCDALPYFRTFNPWLQQKKIDPECIFIKKWIPDLESVPPKIIHKWYDTNYNNQHKLINYQTGEEVFNYPKPIVDHHIESKVARQLYGMSV